MKRALSLVVLVLSCSGDRLTKTHAAISVAPTSVDFGELERGDEAPRRQVTVENTGTTLLFLQATLEGTDSPRFALSDPVPTEVAPGTRATLELEFNATTARVFNATLHLASNAENADSIEVPLTAKTKTAIVRDAGEVVAMDAGTPNHRVDAGRPNGTGQTCASPIVLPAMTASYGGTLVGRLNNFSDCKGTGADVVYQLTIPAGATSVCVRSSSFTPTLHPTAPCGVNNPSDCLGDCCIADSEDAPCDGQACSRWGSPPAGRTIWYVVDATCGDSCACPGGSLSGEYTLDVTVKK